MGMKGFKAKVKFFEKKNEINKKKIPELDDKSLEQLVDEMIKCCKDLERKKIEFLQTMKRENKEPEVNNQKSLDWNIKLYTTKEALTIQSIVRKIIEIKCANPPPQNAADLSPLKGNYKDHLNLANSLFQDIEKTDNHFDPKYILSDG